MATDWYPSQEGRIVDGVTLNCIAETAVAESDCVKFGTSTAGQITVVPATGVGDGWGVAVKAAAAGMPCAVLAYGVYKLTVSEYSTTTLQGEMVMNSANNYVKSCEDLATTEASLYTFGGTSFILGMALQTTSAVSDEFLVLVGKCA